MTPKPGPDPFFVGFFKKVPRSIAVVALSAGGAMVGVLLAAALALPAGMADPGSGRYANDLQGGVLTGVVEPLPYPILRVPAGSDGPARAVLLGGNIKIGVQDQVAALASPAVTAGGVFVRRGDLEMLLMGGDGLKPAPDAGFVPAPAEPLGHWRLTGEICDGKCQAGAMKPGAGLSHKACANLCIDGGLPAVLVMALPVEGSTVVLLADADGGPMPAGLLDLTAVPVEMSGQLERRDDLLIFRIDAGSVRAL
jgi:hypothetical protein